MHVNLLPTSFVWRRLLTHRLRQWGIALGVFVFLMICSNIQLFSKWLRYNSQLQETHASAEPVRELQSQLLQLNLESKSLQHKIDRLDRAVASDQVASILGIVGKGATIAKPLQIQEFHIVVNSKPTPNSVQKNGEAKSSSQSEQSTAVNATETHLTLRGIAGTSESITEFMHYLQSLNVFPNVELRSTSERFISSRVIHEFQLECISHE
jgi:Tfp pilus assembly protein PilN